MIEQLTSRFLAEHADLEEQRLALEKEYQREMETPTSLDGQLRIVVRTGILLGEIKANERKYLDSLYKINK